MKRYILLITIFICILCTGCTTKKNNNDTIEIDPNRELIRVSSRTIGRYLNQSTTGELSSDDREFLYEVSVSCKHPYVVAEELTLKIKVSLQVAYKVYYTIWGETKIEEYSEVITLKLKPNQYSATYKGEIDTFLDEIYYRLHWTTLKASVITSATGVMAG